MPDLTLPATFVSLLLPMRAVFTEPSFQNFRVLVSGWVHARGRHRISDVIRAAGSLADKHFTTYYRFLSHGRWSLDELGMTVLDHVLAALPPGQSVTLVLDDTLSRRSGKKVALASMNADPVLRQGRRPFFSYGHVFVVLAVHVRVPLLARTGWALPFLFRLFESPSRGGTKDSAAYERRERGRRRARKPTRRRERMTDRELRDGALVPCEPKPDLDEIPREARPTKLQLAAEMVLHVARRHPQLRLLVVADHLYAGRALLHTVHSEVENVSFVVRGQPNAALFELPPARRPGQRGRPRVKGERLPSPEAWAREHREAFEDVTVEMYGHDVPLRVASMEGMPYRSLPGRIVRYVIVEDPSGIYRTDYLLSTDESLTPSEVVELYARRWTLERTFQDAKQKLRVEDPQVQRPASVRRAVPMGMLVYSLVVFWYLRHGHEEAARMQVRPDPWYPDKPRPSFSDMLAALRRLGWAAHFVDPPSGQTARQKRAARYLMQVVAAA